MIKKTFQIRTKLLYNKRVKDNYFHCALQAQEIAYQACPGQFVNLKLTDTDEPLLRRPFSIHRVNQQNIEILYEVVGQGTEIFSKKKPGEFLDVIGPLGSGFSFHAITSQRDNESAIIVAAGIGIAPLIFLAEKLAERRILVLIGAKTKDQILCTEEFRKLGCEVKISTDDGSRGFKGKVTDLLKKILPEAMSDKRLAIYACGPRPMLKEISLLSKKYNILSQISLEEHMACGIGACFGCAVHTKEGFKRACKEGPVFNSTEIIW